MWKKLVQFIKDLGPLALLAVLALALFAWMLIATFWERDSAPKEVAPPESFLLAEPVWLPEAGNRNGFGGKVYLVEIKGRRLAVVISNRGAGICELRGWPEFQTEGQ